MRVVGVFLGAILAAFAITLGLRAQFDDLTPAPDTPVYVMAGEYASSRTEASATPQAPETAAPAQATKTSQTAEATAAPEAGGAYG